MPTTPAPDAYPTRDLSKRQTMRATEIVPAYPAHAPDAAADTFHPPHPAACPCPACTPRDATSEAAAHNDPAVPRVKWSARAVAFYAVVIVTIILGAIGSIAAIVSMWGSR